MGDVPGDQAPAEKVQQRRRNNAPRTSLGGSRVATRGPRRASVEGRMTPRAGTNVTMQFSLFGAAAATADARRPRRCAAGRRPVGALAATARGCRSWSPTVAGRRAGRGVRRARVSTAADAVVPAEGGFGGPHRLRADAGRRTRRGGRAAPIGAAAGFDLTPGGLRLWAIAAGPRDEAGYLLATAEAGRRGAPGGRGAAVPPRAGRGVARTRGGPGWRVTSARRLRRLAELLGAPPPAATRVAAGWPERR